MSASFEFYRLCNESRWDKKKRRQAHLDFKDALVKQFNQVYGTDENNLGDWQNLCYIVRIEPIPEDLDTCRKVSTSCLSSLISVWLIGMKW